MRAILLVAGAAFKESVRDRVPYTMVIFAVLMMAASYLISQMTAGQDLKIIKDLGLAALSIFGLLIAVFIGIGLVSKEVEKKSVFALLTKPVTRTQFILGKYLGLVTTLVVNLTVMTVAYYGVLFYMDMTTSATMKAGWPAPALDPRLLIAIVLIVAELALVTAVALFFSDVLQSVAGGVADARSVGGRTLQRRPAPVRERHGREMGRLDCARPVLRVAQPGAVQREGRSGVRRARVAVARRLHAALCGGLLRRVADRRGGDLPPPRFQVALTMAATLPADSSQRPSNRWFYVATAGLLALSIAVQVVRDRGWQAYEPETPVLWFQSGPLLKRVSLGLSQLAGRRVLDPIGGVLRQPAAWSATSTATSTCSIHC